MTDYDRIAAVIRRLDRRRADQPSLDELAREAGLSPSHFHRLFSDWAGVTPKDFLQCLTVEHAKALLRRGAGVLDAALESGLSGPGRLHDLCVTLESATPGDIKTDGAGWTITAGYAGTPFGESLIGTTPRGICHLAFVHAGREESWKELRTRWKNARLDRNDAAARRTAREIFPASPAAASRRPLRAVVNGTAFQLKVWRALLRVPAGALVTYGRLAAHIGHPKASRAVGTAVGRNTLGLLIPCHRVIRETGALGGYRWGPLRKRAILAREAAGAPLPAAAQGL